MKPIIAILVLTAAVSLDVVAQDVRSKVGPSSGASLSNIIDPDKSIYGVQWGSSEDEFISKFGNPTGYIRLNGADTAMLYGKSHAFIFTASKLSGVRINMTVLDWKLSQAILTLTPFDGIRWQLSNGIRREMNLAEVKKILGESLKTDHYQQRYFNSDKARVEIDFYRLSSEGEKDEAYRVSGIYIRQASSATGALQKAPVSARPRYAEVPVATQPCSAEVAKWWQEVRTAAKEVCDATRHEKAKEKFLQLLAEGQVKSYRPPIEDSSTVILYQVPPTYSDEARRKKTQGRVSLQVEFRSDGAIGDVKVVSGPGDGLDEQAIKAMRQIIFLPRIKDGMFVTTSKMIYMEFNLR